MIPKEKLERLYSEKKLSSKEISILLYCSENKINYWLNKHNILKRGISDAMYIKHNPKGDPFCVRQLKHDELFLYGLGLGLYWGEGNKANKNSIRLGNSNHRLILTFIKFLNEIFSVKKEDLRFGLQVFNDVDAKVALNFWINKLQVSSKQFQKVVTSDIRGKGNYKHKSKYGVLTVYFNNTKLRNIICREIEKL